MFLRENEQFSLKMMKIFRIFLVLRQKYEKIVNFSFLTLLVFEAEFPKVQEVTLFSF